MKDLKVILIENMEIFHKRMQALDKCLEEKNFENLNTDDIEVRSLVRKDMGIMATEVINKIDEINNSTELDDCCKHQLIKQLIQIYKSSLY